MWRSKSSIVSSCLPELGWHWHHIASHFAQGGATALVLVNCYEYFVEPLLVLNSGFVFWATRV